jgi:hypothetical protein
MWFIIKIIYIINWLNLKCSFFAHNSDRMILWFMCQIVIVSSIMLPLLASSLMLVHLSKEKYIDDITRPLFEDWCHKSGKVYSSGNEKHDDKFKDFKRLYATLIRHNRCNNNSHIHAFLFFAMLNFCCFQCFFINLNEYNFLS